MEDRFGGASTINSGAPTWGARFASSAWAGVRCYYITVASFYVQNFGCRATQADGAAIERQFEERGLERASAPADAEIVVLNTCTVTAAADQDARAAIRRVHRENPLARIGRDGLLRTTFPRRTSVAARGHAGCWQLHKHQLAELISDDGKSLHLIPRSSRFQP